MYVVKTSEVKVSPNAALIKTIMTIECIFIIVVENMENDLVYKNM